MQRSALCRSRRELSNEYLLAKFGFDTAENEPCKVCPLSAYRSPRFSSLAAVDEGYEDIPLMPTLDELAVLLQLHWHSTKWYIKL